MTERLKLPGTPAWRAAADLRERAKQNYAEWYHGQGVKIRAARPQPVMDACIMFALDLAHLRFPLVLSAEEIAMCDGRAVSQARLRRFGPPGKSAEEWHAQCAEVRNDMAAFKAGRAA